MIDDMILLKNESGPDFLISKKQFQNIIDTQKIFLTTIQEKFSSKKDFELICLLLQMVVGMIAKSFEIKDLDLFFSDFVHNAKIFAKDGGDGIFHPTPGAKQ